MKTKALALKNRLFGSGGTASGILGGLGSLHNICHSICLTIVAVLAVFGISTSILPLMFLQTYQMYFWWAALVFTGVSYYFYMKQRRHRALDRNLLIINIGLLTFGLPFKQISDYRDFFRFIGTSATTIGIFLLVFSKRFHIVNRSPSELEPKLHHSLDDGISTAGTYVQKTSAFHFPKLTPVSALFTFVMAGFLVNQYLMYRMNVMGNMLTGITSTVHQMGQTASQMKFTVFDIALAKERMDKNNDGICDTCGMSIQQCINSGQLDCNMGKNPQAIGVLGSQHIHADWKIYIDGKPFDWSPFANLHERQMAGDTSVTNTSAFIHIHPAQSPENAGDVLHMHAKNVPLSIFFRSLGMNLTKDTLTLADGRVLTNENGKSLKFYLNGHNVDELDNYVFQPLDKMLISYGPENDPDIQKQINSITNFAKDHEGSSQE